MAQFRSLFLAFTFSIAVHALVVYTMSVHPDPPIPNALEPIQIDYVNQGKTTRVAPVVTALPENKPAPSRKKLKGIPIPKMSTIAKTLAPVDTDFQKKIDKKIKKQVSQLRHLSSSMTSAELMADPVQGKIFVGYFSEVKKKIQNTVFQTAGRNLNGRGTVCLGFLLNAEGRLEQLTVLTKGTEADESLKELAVKCIQDSAPFGSFPKELGLQRIFFNITIFFDGL